MSEEEEESVSTDTFEKWEVARLVPIELLVPTYWNANEMPEEEFEALVDEIDRGHFDEPCQIVPIFSGENKGKFWIIGGEHRYKACLLLKKTTVPCVIKEHLDVKDEEELMRWSVRRNHIRGRLNAEKYAQIEARYSKKKMLAAEAARKAMMVKGENLKRLRKHTAVVSNEDDDTEKGGRAPKKVSEKERTASPEEKREKRAKDKPAYLQSTEERQKLLANLRVLEQEILLKSETIEQGYLFFGQGGYDHLVVEEEPHLYKLVEQMVAICKRDSAKINEFLASAISKEIREWE